MNEDRASVTLELCLELASPVAHAGHGPAPADSLSGSALRGAVAALYLRTGSADDALFRSLFLDGTAWPNMYPCGEGTPQPVPLSAVTCSRFPGFDAPGGRSELSLPAPFPRHGVEDTLVTYQVARDASRPGLWTDRQRCPICFRQRQATPLAPYRGYVERLPGGGYRPCAVLHDSVSGAAVDRATGTVRAGGAYELTALAAGNRLAGHVATDAAGAKAIGEELLPPGREIRIGGGRSRGLGLVRVRSCGEVQPGAFPALEERVDGVQRRFGEILGHSEHAAAWRYVSVTLLSDAILLDPFFRFRASLEPGDLGATALELVHQAGDTAIVGGWNAATGLPKEQSVAVRRGSAFLYRYRPEDRDSVVSALATAERLRVGERRAEGFGHIRVGDPFHWEVHDLWQS